MSLALQPIESSIGVVPAGFYDVSGPYFFPYLIMQKITDLFKDSVSTDNLLTVAFYNLRKLTTIRAAAPESALYFNFINSASEKAFIIYYESTYSSQVAAALASYPPLEMPTCTWIPLHKEC